MSRLECKGIFPGLAYKREAIRICPDWNVKASSIYIDKVEQGIRICPDWNVKV